MNNEAGQKAEEKQREIEAQIDELMRFALTPEAKTRLGNVKLVNQELYLKTAQAIIYLQRAGQISGKISEEQLKQLLEKFSKKREIKIKRR